MFYLGHWVSNEKEIFSRAEIDDGALKLLENNLENEIIFEDNNGEVLLTTVSNYKIKEKVKIRFGHGFFEEVSDGKSIRTEISLVSNEAGVGSGACDGKFVKIQQSYNFGYLLKRLAFNGTNMSMIYAIRTGVLFKVSFSRKIPNQDDLFNISENDWFVMDIDPNTAETSLCPSYQNGKSLQDTLNTEPNNLSATKMNSSTIVYNIMDNAIERIALGINAKIGDLYDAQQDAFVGSPISPISSSFVRKSEYVNDSTTQLQGLRKVQILEALQLEKNQILSHLLGMCDPNQDLTLPTKGFFKDCKGSVFLHTNTTVREILNTERCLKPWLQYDEEDEKKATHICIGIEWGIQLFFAHGRNDDSKYFTKIWRDGQEMSNLKFMNPQELNENMKKLLEESENGQGSQIKYILAPIEDLELQSKNTAVQKIYHPISGLEIEDILKTLTDLKFQQFNGIENLLGEFSYCLSSAEFSEISDYFEEFQLSFRNCKGELCMKVLEKRSGNDENIIEEISKILAKLLEPSNSSNNIEFSEKFDKIKCRINDFKNLMKELNAKSIGQHELSYEHENWGNKSEVFVLFYVPPNNEDEETLWFSNLKLFMEIMESFKGSSAEFFINLAEHGEHEDEDQSESDNLSIVAFYKYGKCVDNNLLLKLKPDEETVNQKFTGVCKPLGGFQSQVNKINDMKRCPVEFSCICNKKNNNEFTWVCGICQDVLFYFFDGYFYCKCGRAKAEDYLFFCKSSDHGEYFKMIGAEKCQEIILRKLKPMKEYNILILGETGVGKSTWINGIANYLASPSLSEASGREMISVIPTAFTMVTKAFEDLVITTGSEGNEYHKAGSSATQQPKSYKFIYNGKLINLIDTPGIGDTRGVTQDKENFENIMNHIAHFEDMHGIVILLKPNNSRLTVTFKFCIKELLTHLHKDATRNIIFCFTNARGTFYRPGDTMPALKTLLGENKIPIPVVQETVYCMDNESIRFLSALKQGVDFDAEEQEQFSSSWIKSVQETERMFEYISSLEPHKIKNTLSLNDARRIILELTKPLAEISQNIQTNLLMLEDKQQEVLSSKKTKAELLKRLTVPVVDLEAVNLSYPRTVCTASKCVQVITFDGQKKIDYKTHCHPHCSLSGVQVDICNNPALKQCAAMSASGGVSCSFCGCGWESHQHITYECIQVFKEIQDVNVQMMILSKDGAIQAIEEHMKIVDKRMTALKNEQGQITGITAKFAFFLKHCGIFVYNDVMGEYLDHLIQMEKEKINCGGSKKKKELLTELKRSYTEEVKILESAIQDSKSLDNNKETLPNIESLVKELYSLEYCGKQLKTIVDVANQARKSNSMHLTQTYYPKSQGYAYQNRNSSKAFSNYWPESGFSQHSQYSASSSSYAQNNCEHSIKMDNTGRFYVANNKKTYDIVKTWAKNLGSSFFH